MEGQTQSMIEQSRGTGMGSAGDELRLLVLTNLLISAVGTTWKVVNSGGGWSLAGVELEGGVMLARIFSIFSIK